MEKLIRYKNGLRLIVQNVPSVRSVASSIWVATGSASETSENNGISHFTEHMMFKGTNKLDAYEIANNFEFLGGNINAFTSKECTCYYVKSIDENTEKCFELLSHIFLDSTFPSEELDKERKVILEEINMVEDSPEDICYDLIADSLYGKSPLGRTILGPIDNVKRFKNSDVRNYMSETYCADNLVISMSGNITIEEADKYVRKYLLDKVCQKSTIKNSLTKQEIKSSHSERIKDFEQTNIAISFPSIKFNDKQSSIQGVLSTILGGTMSSRLFQRVREQLGLAYSIYTMPSSFINNGTFNIIVNISVENTAKTLDAIKEEIIKIKNNGITDNEMARAKTQLKTACVFSQENVQSMMSSNGKLLALCDEIYDIDQKIVDIEKVTLQEVDAFAKNIFSSSSEICTAYVGKKHSYDFSKFKI